MFQRSRISLGAIPGRRMGISASCFRDDGWGYPTTMLRRPSPRHPGLALGPKKKATMQKQPSSRHPGLVPGPIQKGRDLNTTPVGCFLDPGKVLRTFRDDGWGYPTAMVRRHPNRHPGLAPGPNKKAVISTQPLLDVSKIPDKRFALSGTTDGGIPPRW